MDFQPSEIQTLVSLGLTSIQARVYLTLVEFGRLNVASISKMSKVARPDVYRNLSRLQQLGLIEEIVKVPTEFQAVPVNTLSFLLQNKTHAYERLKFETEQLLVSFNEKQNQNNNHETENTFILVPQKQAIINRISKAIEEAQNRIDSILSWKRFTQSIVSTYAEIADKAWSRGIESRFIVENPTEGSNFSAFEFCRKNPKCKIKFIYSCPKTIMEIYDGKEVFIIVDPDSGIADSPALWSNNRSLVALTQDYFDILWSTASEEPIIKPKSLSSKFTSH